jgi:hypothetical protein
MYLYLGPHHGQSYTALLTLSPTAPCTPLYLTALGLICPNKNRVDLPEGRELRATVIAASSLRISLLNNFFFFKFNTLKYNFYMELKCNNNGATKK